MILTPRRSNSGLIFAMYPSSVVHTGVKSFGCENRTPHESPSQSWKLIRPSVVSASKSGAVSPICRAIDYPQAFGCRFDALTLREKVFGPGLVLDRLLRSRRHEEAEGQLLLLGQVSKEAGGARQNRNGLDGGGRKAQVEHHRRDGHRDVHRERLAPGLGHAVAEATREQHVGPTDLAGIRELENPFGARVERPMNRVAEPRQLVAGSVDRACHLLGD